MLEFWDAVASAEPYENIYTSVQADNHTNTLSLNFLQAGCFSWRPTSSVKAVKDCGWEVQIRLQQM